jgi:hypothetical protein
MYNKYSRLTEIHRQQYVSLYMDRQLARVVDECQAADAALDKALTLVGDFDNKAAFQIYY